MTKSRLHRTAVGYRSGRFEITRRIDASAGRGANTNRGWTVVDTMTGARTHHTDLSRVREFLAAKEA